MAMLTGDPGPRYNNPTVAYQPLPPSGRAPPGPSHFNPPSEPTPRLPGVVESWRPPTQTYDPVVSLDDFGLPEISEVERLLRDPYARDVWVDVPLNPEPAPAPRAPPNDVDDITNIGTEHDRERVAQTEFDELVRDLEAIQKSGSPVIREGMAAAARARLIMAYGILLAGGTVAGAAYAATHNGAVNDYRIPGPDIDEPVRAPDRPPPNPDADLPGLPHPETPIPVPELPEVPPISKIPGVMMSGGMYPFFRIRHRRKNFV
jgi:hypothetical protein